MSFDLAAKLSGLSSRTNSLAVNTTGDNRRILMEKQDRLAKLTLVAITKELNAEHEDYKKAIEGLNNAITFLGDATRDIENVAKAIQLITDAAEVAEKAVETAS